jgi:hypothetical protein
MPFDAIFTFKDQSQQNRPDVSFHVHKGGLQTESEHMILSLVSFVNRIWQGQEDVDSIAINGASLVRDLASAPTSQHRYEIFVLDGKPVTVVTFVHDPCIPEEMQARHRAAVAALEEVKKEMAEAAKAPNYRQVDVSPVHMLRSRVSGY